MFWGALHRTILFDLFRIFSVALIALTALILLAGIISEAMKNGLGPAQVLIAIPLLLPSMLPYTVPTTTLFATCMVYGRLSADHEILALKVAGVHLIHVVWPALLLGLCTTALTLFLSLSVIPYTHSLLKLHMMGNVEELLYTRLRKDGCIRHQKLGYEIYARTMHGRKLHDAQILRRSRNGKHFDAIMSASEAELHVDLDHQRILFEMRQCQFLQGNGTVGFVEASVWPIDLPREMTNATLKTHTMDMTWDELHVYQGRFLQEKHKISLDIDSHQGVINLGSAPPNFQEHVRNRISERKVLDNQLFAIDSEYHQRLSLALGCICFALLGCPIGIWFSKSDYLSAFMTCFLPIVTLYYPFLFCMINMSRSGRILPWIGIYNANVLLLLAGLVLLRRLLRH